MKLNLVLDDPDETVIESDVFTFLSENQWNDECVEAVASLYSGDAEAWIGGGAMPITILRLVRANGEAAR